MKIIFLVVVIIYGVGVCRGERSELINPFSLRNDQISILKIGVKKQEELTILKERLPKEEIKPVEEKELEKKEEESEELPPSFVMTQPRPTLKKTSPTALITPKLPPREVAQIPLPSKIEDKTSQIQMPQELPVKPKPSPEVIIKKVVKDTKLRMINLVMWGLFSIIGIVLLGVYIVSRRGESGLSYRLLFPPRSTQIDAELRQLRIGYKGIERMLADLEKKLVLTEELAGQSIRDFTQNIVKEALLPFAQTLNKFEQSNKDLELMLEEMREKLLPIEDLKGVNIIELIRKISNQCALEVNRPLEERLELIKTMHKRSLAEFEEKMDKKLVQTLKKFKSIEKYALELDKKVGSLDSQVATLSVSQEAQQIIGPRKIPTTQEEKEEEIKEKDSSQRAKLHELIYKLSEEGLGIDEIAERTKLGKGEIKLILSLKKEE